jgi:ABC-type molybdate transport system substrate-binding protein
MLAKGKNNPAAHEFYTFIQGDAAQAIILKHGYGVEL